MSNIPEAREILAALRAEIPLRHRRQIDAALVLMRRRPPAKPRAEPKGGRLDARLAEKIRKYVRRHPRVAIRDVGRAFGVDGGRVSEALHHDR